MYRRLAIILFILSALIQPGSGQGTGNALQFPTTEVYGVVRDASTREPLPYVNIKLIGLKRNENTDPKGHFYIKTIEKLDSIQFSFIGYSTRTVPVIRGKVQEINIELGSHELKLTEITVKAKSKQKHVVDTAANYVYYQVLKYKDQNRGDGVRSYKYDCYDKLMISLLNPSQKLINFFLLKPFKFVFNNKDTTENGDVFIPGILKETISEVYYRKNPKANKKFIKSDIISGIDNPSIGNLANYQFAEIDPYSNLFVIAGISFISPFSPRGIGEYYYYLTDTAKIDGRISYRLHFVGKVKEDAALKGYAWIDSATWAIRSIVFRPNEKANFNFVNDYTVRQDYTFVNEKYWIMNRETLHTVGSALKRKNAIKLMITKVHTRKNIQADIEFPDTIFKGIDEQVLLDSARLRSPTWWDSSRFETLTRQEKEVYHMTDTIKTVRAWKTYEFFGRFLSVAYADAGPISIGKILNFVSKNNVEGWRLRFGFETNARFQHSGTPANKFLKTFYFTGYGAYGLKDHVWQYLALTRIMLPWKNDHWQTLEGMYRYDMRVPGQDPDQTLITFDNIINLIGGTVFTRIMRTREFRITYEKEWFSGFSTIVSMNQKMIYDIPGVFDFSHHGMEVPNFGVTNFTINCHYSYKGQYFVGIPYRYFIATKYPVFTFRYTAGIVNMQGNYFNFHNIQVSAGQRLSSAAGHTSYDLKAGKIFGKTPYTEAYLTEGNPGYIYNKFSFNLLSEFEFVSDQYVSLKLEHHFEGFFFNKIPGFNKLRLREIIFARGIIGSFSPKNADVLTTPRELSQPGPIPYVEAGFGIENILSMFRIDFLWRATYRNVPGLPNWGVKIAFNPGF